MLETLILESNYFNYFINSSWRAYKLEYFNVPAQELIELSMIMTTEAALVEENPKPKSESDQAESVETTVVPLYQYVSNGAPIVTEPQPEHTSVLPVLNEEVAFTESPLEEIKGTSHTLFILFPCEMVKLLVIHRTPTGFVHLSTRNHHRG